MKKIKITITIIGMFVALLVSHACMTKVMIYPQDDNPVVSKHVTTKPVLGLPDLMSHIIQRTVLVINDCSPKSNALSFGGEDLSKVRDQTGTGVIISSTPNFSFVSTAAHVVTLPTNREHLHLSCVTKVVRVTKDGKVSTHTATIVSLHVGRDLAILKIADDYKVNTDISVSTYLGEDIWAAGFPAQFMGDAHHLSITRGVIATKNIQRCKNLRKCGKAHRVTSDIYFGSSGGGVWSRSGKLVGMVRGMSLSSPRVARSGYFYIKPIRETIQLLAETGKLGVVFKQ